MSGLTVPPDHADYPCVLVPVPQWLIPAVVGNLEWLLRETSWTTESDWQVGYSAVAGVIAVATNRCLQELIESNRQIYRLLDTNLTGAEYIADEVNGETIVTPPIPAAPAVPTRALHSRLERIEFVLDNAYNGALHDPDFLNPIGVRQLLGEILTALQTQDLDTEALLPVLEQIALLLA